MQPVSQSINQLISKPVGKSASQSNNSSVKQSTSQSINQSINQCACSVQLIFLKESLTNGGTCESKWAELALPPVRVHWPKTTSTPVTTAGKKLRRW